MKGGLLLDVAGQKWSWLTGDRFLCNSLIRQGASILQLLSGKDQALLIRGDTVREG